MSTREKNASYYYPHYSEKDKELLSSMINEDEEVGDDGNIDGGNEDRSDGVEEDSGVLDAEDVTAVNHVRDMVLDTADEAVNGNQASFSLNIKLPDKETYLYKTTLVALLNSSPDGKLSKDRLCCRCCQLSQNYWLVLRYCSFKKRQ